MHRELCNKRKKITCRKLDIPQMLGEIDRFLFCDIPSRIVAAAFSLARARKTRATDLARFPIREGLDQNSGSGPFFECT